MQPMKQLQKMLQKHLNGENDTNTTFNVSEDLNGTEVDLKRATGNPLFALLAVLLIISVSGIRRFKK